MRVKKVVEKIIKIDRKVVVDVKDHVELNVVVVVVVDSEKIETVEDFDVVNVVNNVTEVTVVQNDFHQDIVVDYVMDVDTPLIEDELEMVDIDEGIVGNMEKVKIVAIIINVGSINM